MGFKSGRALPTQSSTAAAYIVKSTIGSCVLKQNCSEHDLHDLQVKAPAIHIHLGLVHILKLALLGVEGAQLRST